MHSTSVLTWLQKAIDHLPLLSSNIHAIYGLFFTFVYTQALRKVKQYCIEIIFTFQFINLLSNHSIFKPLEIFLPWFLHYYAVKKDTVHQHFLFTVYSPLCHWPQTVEPEGKHTLHSSGPASELRHQRHGVFSISEHNHHWNEQNHTITYTENII